MTSLVAFLCIYITIIALFGRNLINPLEIRNATNVSDVGPYNNEEIFDYADEVLNRTMFQDLPSYEEDYILTIVSLFFLWVCALAFGKIVNYAFLPPLLGNTHDYSANNS